MLWTVLVGFLVFMALVLLLGGEWWSSSKGVLKDKQDKQDKEKREKEQGPPKPGP